MSLVPRDPNLFAIQLMIEAIDKLASVTNKALDPPELNQEDVQTMMYVIQAAERSGATEVSYNITKKSVLGLDIDFENGFNVGFGRNVRSQHQFNIKFK